FRFNDFEKKIWITYPQGELTGPERLLANIYDTVGGVSEARFRIATIETPMLAEGDLARVSPFSWSASLAQKDLGLRNPLPDNWLLRVRATNRNGEQWETSRTISRIGRAGVAPAVKLGENWPQFMGNAQRTGRAKQAVALPVSL